MFLVAFSAVNKMALLESAYSTFESNLNHANNSSSKQHRFSPKWCKVDDTLEGPTPRPRHGHRAVAIKELMLVFGGGNEGIVDELHLYDTIANQWYIPDLRGNKPRGYAAYGMVTNQSKVFIFGGMVEFGRYSNDLFELHTKRWEWRQLRVRAPTDGQPEPCPRLGHSFTIGLNNIAYVFGGLANDSDDPKFNVPKYLNDFYAIDLGATSNTFLWHCPQTNGQRPSPRESHTAVYFNTQTGNEQLIIYGGMNGVRLGDVWILDLVTMNWSNPVPAGIEPLPRSLHTANLIGHRMFIFGGWVPTRSEDKLEHPDKEWKCTSALAVLNLNTLRWEHSLGTHSSQSSSSVFTAFWPTARAGHSAAVINKRIYIWSGRDGYKKMWNSQVCCKDMFFLETEPPTVPSGIQLVKATVNSLEISWSSSTTADRYILQIQQAEHQPDSEKVGKRSGVRSAQRQPFGSVGAALPHQRAVLGGSASTSSSPVRAIRSSTAAFTTPSYRRYYHTEQQMNSSSPVLLTARPLRIKSSDVTSPRSSIGLQQQQHRILQQISRIGSMTDSSVGTTAASPSSPVSSHPTTTYNQRHYQLSNASPRTIIVHKSAPMVSSSDSEGVSIAGPATMPVTGPKRIFVHSSSCQQLSTEPLVATTGRMIKQFPNCPPRQRQAMAPSNTFDILPSPAKMMKHMDFVPTVPGMVSSSESPLSSTTAKTTYSVPAAPVIIDQSMPHNILDEALNEAENFVDEQQQQLLQQQGHCFNIENTNNLSEQQQFSIISSEQSTHEKAEDEETKNETVKEGREEEKNNYDSPSKYQLVAGAMKVTKLEGNNNIGDNSISKNDEEKKGIDDDGDCGELGVEQMRATDPDSESDSTALKEESVSQRHAAELLQPLERDYNHQQRQGHEPLIDSGNKWFHVVDLPSSTQRFVITQYSIPCDDGGGSTEGERVACPTMEIGLQLVSDEQLGVQQQQLTAFNEQQRRIIVALKPGTLYRIRCRALNSVGYSAWSQPVSFKTCVPGFPGSPTSIKITKCPEGVYISWDPPLSSNGQIEEYSVFLLTRSQQHGTNTHPHQASTASFTRVYVGLAPNCVIFHSVLGLAHIDMATTPKPAIIFRISARNEKGYGSATQVRWLQEPPTRAVPVAVMPPGTLHPTTTAGPSLSLADTTMLPQQQYHHHFPSPSANIISSSVSSSGRVVQKRTAFAAHQQQFHQLYHQRHKHNQRPLPNMMTTTANPNISVREFLSNSTSASKRGL